MGIQKLYINDQKEYEKILKITNLQGYAKQKQKELSSHNCQAGFKEKKDNRAAKDVKKLEPLYTVDSNVK